MKNLKEKSPFGIDMMDGKCSDDRCSGSYQETSLHDDWNGVLHCEECGDETARYPLLEAQRVQQAIMDENKAETINRLYLYLQALRGQDRKEAQESIDRTIKISPDYAREFVELWSSDWEAAMQQFRIAHAFYCRDVIPKDEE